MCPSCNLVTQQDGLKYLLNVITCKIVLLIFKNHLLTGRRGSREKRLQHNRKANRDKGKPVVLLGVSLGILWDLAKEFSIHEAGHSKLKSVMEVAPIHVRI